MSSSYYTALVNMRRSPYQTILALSVLSITFFVTYIFAMMMIGSEMVLQYFETQPQITAFFETNADPSQVTTAEQVMSEKPYVQEIRVISKEEALQIYQEDNKEDPVLLQLVTADILPASIEVSGNDINSLQLIERDLQALEGIDEVIYQKEVVETLSNWTRSVRTVGAAMVGLLVFTSILVIMVITSMKVSMRRNAIKIMRLIGASGWYIKGPFLFEGMYYGIIGALIGWVFVYVLLLYATPWLLEFLGDIQLLPVPIEYMLAFLGVGVLSGIIIGGFASLFASGRYIKN